MKIKLLYLVLLICFTQFAWTIDPVPNLIISEIHMSEVYSAYVEITNVGTEPVDLSRVVISAAQSGGNFSNDITRNSQFLNGAPFLAPGESFVVINHRTDVIDTTIIQTVLWYYGYADYLLYYTRRTNFSGMRFTGGNDAFGIFWDRDDEGLGTFDSNLDTLLDVVGYVGVDLPFDVAGVTNASITHAMIRKANVTKGNSGNFPSSAGVSSEDSEWIPVAYNPDQLGTMFTTVGRHGNTFTWDFSLKSGTIIDDNKISMPWGAWRDSIYKEFNVGPNMAWHLRWGPDTLESNVVQTGDTLLVYLCGNEVETRKYAITVTEPMESNNKVFPLFSRTNSGNLTTQFLVTEDNPVIDTLFSIPFGTRIDSVLKYLEIAPGASWEYKTSDGATRADAKTGDKLAVTAQNGDKKEYYVKTDVYSPSDNAALRTILIDNDTLWNFSASTLTYKFIIDADAQRFPSISATPQNNDARVVIKQPAYIRGSDEDRTATIKVIAENDTTIINYTLTFDFSKPVQVNKLDPFISQVVYAGTGMTKRGFEIFNPSNVPISLADYMLVRSTPPNSGPASLEEAISETDSSSRTYMLKMGYYFDNKRAGEGVYFKEATNYIIDVEPFDVWFLKRSFTTTWGGADFYSETSGQVAMYGWPDGADLAITQNGTNFWLLKCTNDSILNGLKSADDPGDWEFIDIWGTVGEPFDHTRTIDGTTLAWKVDHQLIRKGNIWHGNPEPYGSIAEPDGPGSSEWFILSGLDYDGPLNDVNRHAGFIPPTSFASTVTSSSYVVSAGYGKNESIKGVFPGSDVTTFYGNLVKADPDQVLAVKAADGSGARGLSDAMQTGDTLVVISKDLKNTTRYKITASFLSTNAVLTSDLYTIGLSGTTGTIGTIESFTTINELLGHLTLPAGAFMNIIDNQRRHVPLLHMAPDTLIAIDPVVHDSIFLEVIAEDGVTKILYSMVMGDSEPYITSNVYYIYQGAKVIDLWRFNTNIKTFMSNVTPSKGATIKVLDKYDYQRTEGNMYIDDKVVVTNSQSVSATYTLKEFSDMSVVIDPTSIKGAGNGMLTSTHSIYPNPTAGLLNIGGLETGSKVAVINFQGAVTQIRQAYSGSMEIDLSDYAEGIYFIRIIKDQKSVTYKFIKQ